MKTAPLRLNAIPRQELGSFFVVELRLIESALLRLRAALVHQASEFFFLRGVGNDLESAEAARALLLAEVANADADPGRGDEIRNALRLQKRNDKRDMDFSAP